MRIAVWHNLPSGGGKRSLYEHVRGLLAQGHEVELWCPTTADREFLPLGHLVREHILPLEWEPPRPRGRVSELLFPYQSWAWRIDAMRRHCEACAKEINRGGFDVLFANTSMFTAVAPMAHYVDVPKVLYLQEPNRSLYEAYRGLPWIAAERKPRTPVTPRAIKRFAEDLIHVQGLRLLAREEYENAKAYDRILVNSYFSREGLLRTFGLDSTVCYLGVDTSCFRDLALPREPYLVGVGAFAAVKNIELAIRAIATIPPPRPPLLWAGNSAVSSYVRELQALAASLAVDFRTCRQVPGDEVVDILNRASLMVYTSRLEPFGLAPLEANACGLAVVGVAEGGIRETVVDGVTGLMADPTPEAVGRAITCLLNDPDYARQLGRQGRVRVEQEFSTEAACLRVERALLEAIGGAIRHAPRLEPVPVAG